MPDLSKPDWKVSERARKVHAEALVWDDHAGFEPDPKVDLEILENWRAAGVDYLSVNVGYDVVPWQKTIKNIGAFITWLEKNADRFTLVRTVGDIDAAKREGKLAIAFDIEGMNSLDGEAYMVSFYYRLGVRQMLFAYNLNNLAGSGCHDKDTGLTEFGRQVIAEMNRVGMLCDLSHVGPATSRDVILASNKPVAYTHILPAALKAHPRNKSDEEIRFIADRGGFVGVTMFPPFLARGNDATIDDYVEAIDYVAHIAGEDNVGIGTDFTQDHERSFFEWLCHDKGYARRLVDFSDVVNPLGLRRLGEFPNLTGAMQRAGWSERRIRKIMGENWIRLLREVWGK